MLCFAVINFVIVYGAVDSRRSGCVFMMLFLFLPSLVRSFSVRFLRMPNPLIETRTCLPSSELPTSCNA